MFDVDLNTLNPVVRPQVYVFWWVTINSNINQSVPCIDNNKCKSIMKTLLCMWCVSRALHLDIVKVTLSHFVSCRCSISVHAEQWWCSAFWGQSLWWRFPLLVCWTDCTEGLVSFLLRVWTQKQPNHPFKHCCQHSSHYPYLQLKAKQEWRTGGEPVSQWNSTSPSLSVLCLLYRWQTNSFT